MGGRLLATAVWLYSPELAQQLMERASTLIFGWQRDLLMSQLESKLAALGEEKRVVIPILFGNGNQAVALPTQSLHQTYLVAEKREDLFNLYWVNRPDVLMRHKLDLAQVMEQIGGMLEKRYPLMHAIESCKPEFPESSAKNIAAQGSQTNCVVSNVFGMLELLDSLKNDTTLTAMRNSAVRCKLSHYYSFYQKDFSPFGTEEKGFSYERVWQESQNHLFDAI
jgi:hypothetical protein